MRLTKILSVCLGVVFVLALHLNGNSGALTAGSNLQNPAVLLDGGRPLPPPTLADGGRPLPPPVLADGGRPLPPPSSHTVDFTVLA
jgi:hypothetical protein